MKKRSLLILMLILAMALSACAPAASTPTQPAAQGPAEDFSNFKLGVVTWSTTDTLGKKQHDQVTYAIEDVLGGQTVYNTDATSPESQITCVENLIAAGCNAILIVNYSDSILVKIAEICEKNQVYFIQFGRTIRDEAVKEKVEACPYYVGRSYVDDYARGYDMGKLLADQGYTKIAVTTNTVGDTTIDLRDEGFNQACEDFGMERIAEVRAQGDATVIGKGVENFLASFPEMEAIYMPATTNNYLETTLNILEKSGKIGEIKLACIGFTESAKDYVDRDAFTAVMEGDFIDPMLSSIVLANAWAGTPLADGPSELHIKSFLMKNSQEVQDYYTYVDCDEPLFSPEEIRNMCRIYNPDFDMEAMQELVNNLSVESLKEKKLAAQ